jgi:hypothetical protein
VPVRLALAAVLLILLAAGGVRLTQPLDVGSSVSLPRRILRVAARDDVAYPFHSTLGEVLYHLRYPSDAVGVQWVKAAFHVRTRAELDRTIQRLAATRRREAPEAFDRAVCPYSHGGDAIVRIALAKAGMDCPSEPTSGRESTSGRETRRRALRAIMVD